MWFANSYTTKVIVWLAAALMPCDMLLAGTCPCNQQQTGSPQAKISTPATCCCHPGAVCQCRHRAERSRQSACCKSRIHLPVSSRAAIVTLCTCSGNRAPAPQIPLPDSSAAKQTIGQAYACLGLMAVVEYSSSTLHFAGNYPSIPSTPLERLSNLCRLII